MTVIGAALSPDQQLQWPSPILSATEKALTAKHAQWMYYMDPIALVPELIKSKKFMDNVYKGMAQFIDCPTKPWQFTAWA